MEKHKLIGAKTVNPGKIAFDLKNADEGAHLRAEINTNLTVQIGIEAAEAAGFEEGKSRTVSEDAKTFKLGPSGFKEN